MHPIYTNEAKSLLDETYPAAYPMKVRGTLRKFLHDGSSNVFACQPHQRRKAATLYTSGVDAAIKKITRMLEPYSALPTDGLFDDYAPVLAHPTGMIYWDDLRRGVDLVVLYDILVALTYRYPTLQSVPAATLRRQAHVIAMRPLFRVMRATRILNSGRAFEHG
ncbi:hypothetical protein EGJ28_16725 [Stutzerimonas xanthomarina]|jgi:hypothetical protein|uniref:Uncharacterized protein n=1 Tax=Stutzerimonas xanthomarina TaxID=271420 RepID=A0A3R8U288_9GAMM|nr:MULTISPECIES: hypothetical protein [Stutzerimonas]KIL03224.1 hypothetical protein QX25_18820 [Stutzerimonas stutzeri]MBK3920049.1 hypothetical protein [Stutzerimonas frequens]RRV08907.1 hypothetical protein EGJ28_16725 [Stutzerimonas xanthomarina]